MILSLVNNSYQYELQKLCMLFLPYDKIISAPPVDEGDNAVAAIFEEEETARLEVDLRLGGKTESRNDTIALATPDYEKECERRLAVMLFDCFCVLTGRRPPWGILTGVRPAKLMGRLSDSMGENEAKRYFTEKLLVTPKKADLCIATHRSEKAITDLSVKNSASLYISIPFCPTRCAYCSFVSHSVENAGKLIDEYIELLCKEIAHTGALAADCGLRIETIYIGGGTPTVLSPAQLSRVTAAVAQNFDLSTVREYTVEAGRPDTITLEKMTALKDGGVDRVCINPQTMNDRVLEAIGRKHTSRQTVEAFRIAREAGFKNINTDLIAGLPLDTEESFCQSLREIVALNPEEITVHALAMKRASRLTAEDYRSEVSADGMVEFCAEFLPQNGFLPYYMYRQSKTVGNLENVGYAKKGFEGLYNVYIMDETHTILGCGASAVTKLRRYGEPTIQRIFNLKYPYEYISRFPEMLSRKEGIKEFYNE